jgi:hypothetical protein
MVEESIVEQAERLLDSVEDTTPWVGNYITDDIVSIRQADGFPAVAPHPESMSMLTGDPDALELIVNAPRIIRGLLDLIKNEGNQG